MKTRGRGVDRDCRMHNHRKGDRSIVDTQAIALCSLLALSSLVVLLSLLLLSLLLLIANVVTLHCTHGHTYMHNEELIERVQQSRCTCRQTRSDVVLQWQLLGVLLLMPLLMLRMWMPGRSCRWRFPCALARKKA
ncbi:MAG: hypothetical protein JOS17DRAFT_16468 [Linnemannia elongata]|nr:MAG: hypothetical protein JOS17DRAFT_16468 [Linnemannia elongata]